MNWDALGAIGELVGAAAVILTLVFLAFQIRSNTKAIQANAQYDIQIRLSDVSFQIGYSPERSALWSKILDETLSEEDFDDAELGQVHWIIRGLLVTYLAAFASYKKGMMPIEQWRIDRDFIRRFVALPVVKPVVDTEIDQGIINAEFRKEVLERVKKADLSMGRKRS
jgi:hypothetical protein